MDKYSEFTLKVIAVIQKIPKGHVATYQQIAGLAGRVHASRGVSWILHSSSKKFGLPWHRVVSSKGKIAFAPQTQEFLWQRRLLQKEGVAVEAWSGRIDMQRFQYKKKPKIELRYSR